MNIRTVLTKAVSAILGAVTMAGFLTGTVEATTIGFSNVTTNGPYYNALSEGLKTSAEKAGFKIILTDAGGKMDKQIADVEDMLSQHIDFLVLNPVDPIAAIPIVKKAVAAGVPVIAVDSGISDDAPVLTRVAADNAGGSRAVGEYAAKVLSGKKIKVCLVSGSQGSVVGQIRHLGFIGGLVLGQLQSKNSTDFEVLTQVWGGWNQAGGLKAMEDALVGQSELNAVFTDNDDMALGAIRAIKAAGKSDQIKVFSFDGNKATLQAVKDGQVAATAVNAPVEQSARVVEVISAYLKGQKAFPSTIQVAAPEVDSGNVGQFYKPDALF
jgi:ribose transport system substrate-binding protein